MSAQLSSPSSSPRKKYIINEDDDEEQATLHVQEEDARAFREYQLHQESLASEKTLAHEELLAQQDPDTEVEPEIENSELVDNSSITASPRKVPFRGFLSGNEHSINLLNAMILHPPFDKATGSTVPARWQRVAEALHEVGENIIRIAGGANIYENVIGRTCQRSWATFREEYKTHERASRSLTGAVENETPWTNLLRTVVELEDLELGKMKEATKSRKRSAELQEQSSHDGAMLVEAAMSCVRSPRSIEDTNVSSEKRSRPRREKDNAITMVREAIQQTREQISEAKETQLIRDNEEREAQGKHDNEMKEILRRLEDSSNLQATALEAVVSRQEAVANKQEEAVNRQTVAIEALAAAILGKK
ncbi:hypothetical protein BGZ46_002005 [Entomortierella lignicola]|nr:hypothetical protein BGZ46_002005 [Entomortierella lignicola]